MPVRRLALLVIVAGLMLGSLAISGGYAWYLRGHAYRARCAAVLSRRLGLPADIGAVAPLSRTARQFRDVVVWLPQRRGRALTCQRAIVAGAPRADDPNAYELRLEGGWCEISTRTWLREDYRGVVESGLRSGFAPGGPERVMFTAMEVSFERDGFRATLAEAAGRIDFTGPGRASIACPVFNGFRSERPMVIAASFSPLNGGIRIDRLDLSVPELPVRVAGLRELLGVPLVAGTFDGQLVYEEQEPGWRLTVSGRCRELELPECTAGFTPTPWRGRCPEIELQELRVENGRPTRLRFRGRLTDVALGDLLATWGLPGAAGTLTLEVGSADIAPEGVARFVASGTGSGVALEPLTAALGWGTMSGTLDLTIGDLTIEHSRLKSLDALVRVAPAPPAPDAAGTAGWIEGRLVRELVRRTLKFDLPALLPERIAYTRLGLRLEVRDEVLYVFGTHGEREKTILTVRLMDQDLPLIFEPQHSFDLRPLLDGLRAQLRHRLGERIDNLPDGL